MTSAASPMIGYGFMGATHSVGWRQAPRMFDLPDAVEMAVIVGRNADAVAAAAEKWGWAESATDWREVIARDDIDIVDIVTPGDSHAEIAIAALEAGKHVLCEKPLANTVEEAEAMADAAARAAERGVRSMVGLHLPPRSRGDLSARPDRRGRRRHGAAGARRVPAGLARRSRDAAGLAPAEGARRLGRAGRHRRAHHRHDPVRDRPDRRRRVGHDRHDREGAAAAGLGLRVCRARPARGTARSPSTTSRIFTGRLSNGALVSFEATRFATGRKNALTIEVSGDKGALAFDLEDLNSLQFYDRTAPEDRQGFTKILVTEAQHPYVAAWWPAGHMLGYEHGFSHQVVDLVTAIAEGTDPHPSFAEGLSVQRVLDAVERLERERIRLGPHRRGRPGIRLKNPPEGKQR